LGKLSFKVSEKGAVSATQTVVCSLNAVQTGLLPPSITGFRMKTTLANGVTTVEALPFFYDWASFYGVFPEGATREFTCQLGRTIVINPGARLQD
jgi:hypothetical protein